MTENEADQIQQLRHELAIHVVKDDANMTTLLNSLGNVERQVSDLSKVLNERFTDLSTNTSRRFSEMAETASKEAATVNARFTVQSSRMHSYLISVTGAGWSVAIFLALKMWKII